ncbi:MAG TPA: hypothetical protein VIY48_20350 [Candidatus Paceibacterota bacterium]
MVRKPVVPFIIRAEDKLRKPDFCWLTGDPMPVGTPIALCRWGDGDGDWEKAKLTVAKKHSMNVANMTTEEDFSTPDVSWRELDTWVGRNRYGIYVQNQLIHTTSAQDKAVGAVEALTVVLNRHPELADKIS